MSRLISRLAAVFMVALAVSAAQPQRGTTRRPSVNFDGQQIFRYDTFGDEQLWTNELRMQQAIRNLSPATALSVGLKVDSDSLPQSVISAIQMGQVNLNDPAVTIQLLKLNAVVGVIGKVVGENNQLVTIGVTCALCHSTVDNSVMDGIGKRLDGWPNIDLNVGAIVALSPVVADKTPYLTWGRGKYDPRFTAFDGRRLIPLNSPTFPVVIPPAYGLQNVGFEIFTGDGPISYWNNYVAVTQMGGQGDFRDDRIGLRITQRPDMVTPKLPALLAYQLSLQTPAPGSFDAAAADRGEALFMGIAQCSTCHIPPTYTDVLNGPSPLVPLLHAPSETGMEAVYAERSATHLYRTTPLRGLARHPPYFHDGSAARLMDVVNHYAGKLPITLSESDKADLVEFLKSL
jgi:mono/diheme cytochrome c family protein